MSMGCSKQSFCRLCLNIIGDTDFEVIEDIVSGILQVVLPSLDLETKDKHMCGTCHVKLIAAFNFKSMCIDTEDVIISYINSEQMPVVELKDVYLKEKGNVKLTDMSENQKICRLCIQLVTYGFISINEVDVDIIVNYIPEVNINATKEPVICGLCFDSLCRYDSFVKNSLDAQEKYVQFCNKAEKNEIKTEQSDLSSSLNSEEFEIEKTCLDVQTQSYIKTEEIDIKAEEGDKDSDSSSHDLFVGTVRNNKGKCVFGGSDETIDQCVHQCRARDVQIDERKSRIHRSEVPFDIQSAKSEYKNEFKCDAPELEKYKLNESEYETNCQQTFTGHQSVHMGPSEVPMYKCDEHNFQTIHKNCLMLHKLKHEDVSKPQMYKCRICNYQSKNKGDLKVHQLRHKDSSEIQMYMCDVCNFETKYKSALKTHQLIHKNPSEVQTYKCDACSYITKIKGHLKQHQLTHKDPSEIQMYKCNACSYESKNKSHLKVHQLKHKDSSEIQMHNCDMCNYTTKYKSTLKTHQLTHKDPSEVQMFRCDKCTYESKYKSALKVHRLIHKELSEVQIYKCNMCQYQSNQKDNLKGHQIIHRSSLEFQMYKCEQCDYETKHQSRLKLHQLVHKNPSEIQM